MFKNSIRISVLGAVGSGKSSLCSRFVNNYVEEIYIKDDQTNEFVRTFNFNQGDERLSKVLQIDDVVGVNHEILADDDQNDQKVLFERIIENSGPKKNLEEAKKSGEFDGDDEKNKWRSISVYFFLYDLNSKDSLDDIEDVIKHINTREVRDASKKNPNISIKYLVGTKSDMMLEDTPTFIKDIEKLGKKYNLIDKKISALYNTGVEELFTKAVYDAVNRQKAKDKNKEEENRRKARSYWCAGRGDGDEDCILL